MAALPSAAGMPDTITARKAVADSLLTGPSCDFHRNLEISTHYAWIYQRLPTCLKWAGMAAIASHHVRRALFGTNLWIPDGSHPFTWGSPFRPGAMPTRVRRSPGGQRPP